jgi:hypothetical protein
VAGNAELLVELNGSKRSLRISSLLDPTDGIGGLLSAYEIAPDDPVEPQADPRSDAEDEMRQLAALGFRGTVRVQPDGRYTLEVSVDAVSGRAREAGWRHTSLATQRPRRSTSQAIQSVC